MTPKEKELLDSLNSHERNAVYLARAKFGVSFRKALDIYMKLGDDGVINAKVEAEERVECQCRYCGKHYFIGKRYGNRQYCKYCHLVGFDNVHRFTGKTNGWDAKPRERVAIVNGWRGRVCTGFKATMGFNK